MFCFISGFIWCCSCISLIRKIFIHFRVSAAYLCWVFHSSDHDEEIESSSCFMLMLCSKNSRSTLMLLLTTIMCERVRRTSVIHAYWWRNLLVCIFPQYDDTRDARWSSPLTTINNDRRRIIVCSKQQFHQRLLAQAQHKDIRENTDEKTQATTENATQTRPHDSHGNVLRRYYFSFKIRVLVFVDIFNSIHFCLLQAHVRLTRNIKYGN